MKKTISLLFFLLFFISSNTLFSQVITTRTTQDLLVPKITKIFLPEYPDAHNPSLVDTDQGLLLTFRWLPDPLFPWISRIGVVFLDEKLQPISKPQLLDTRKGNKIIPSQSEDARIFSYQGDLYVVYNDNNTFGNPTDLHRRDMFIAQLSYADDQFALSEPLKLYHQQKYAAVKWQKNWVPFEWHGALLFSYSLMPHEVLYTDLSSGECISFVNTPFANPKWQWKWGSWRGGTPATLVDDEYLAFFHSSIVIDSDVSHGMLMHHYFMGAYTFSQEPPFEITTVTPSPMIANGFYTASSYSKRVVFPGGYVVRDKHFYVAYGKDDQEMWIATIDREALKEALVPVSSLK